MAFPEALSRREPRILSILAVGDSYLSSAVFAESFAPLERLHSISYVDVPGDLEFVPSTESERRLREFAGSPAWLADALDGHDVLVVHGAAVSAEVLDAAPSLALICCARGGPVNVDVEAAAARGIAVVTTPGKNAEAVAELSLALMVMLARRVPQAMAKRLADELGASAFEGAEFFGHELGGHTLGLIGFGNVGARVNVRAQAFGMDVIVHDPFLPNDQLERAGVRGAGLDELLRTADFVSLHARATSENAGLIDAACFEAMKPSAYFVNTARASLVDEAALADALRSGGIAGAALDVLSPPQDGDEHPLARLENVIVTPHIGGATYETLRRGASMIAADIERFSAGEALLHAVDGRKEETCPKPTPATPSGSQNTSPRSRASSI